MILYLVPPNALTGVMLMRQQKKAYNELTESLYGYGPYMSLWISIVSKAIKSYPDIKYKFWRKLNDTPYAGFKITCDRETMVLFMLGNLGNDTFELIDEDEWDPTIKRLINGKRKVGANSW